MNKRIIIVFLLILAIILASISIYVGFQLSQQPEDVPTPTITITPTPTEAITPVTGDFVCRDRPFDIVLAIDSSGSPVDSEIDDDIFDAVDFFVDELDLENNRISLMDKRGWGSYHNTGFSIDKEFLKSEFKTFGFQGGPPCRTWPNGGADRDCTTGGESDKITDKLDAFLSENQRTSDNGQVIPVVIIVFDDGDESQLPQSVGGDNRDGQNSCTADTTELTKWQNLDQYGDIYWLRFTNDRTNQCDFWSEPGNMVRGNGEVVEYDYSNPDTSTQNLVDALETIFQDQCFSPLDIEKTDSIENIGASSATVEYTLTVTNPNDIAFDDILIRDQLETFTESVSEISNDGVYDAVSQTIEWEFDTIAANGSITVTFVAEYSSENYGDIDNLSIVYNDEDGDGDFSDEEENDRDDVTTRIDADTSILVNKSAVVASNSSQHVVSYSIEVTNNSTLALENLTVTDTLDSKIQSSWVTNISDSGTLSNKVITWEIDTLSVSGSTTFTYTVVIPVGEEGTYENVVIVTDEDDEELGRDTHDVDISIGSIPATAIFDDQTDKILLGIVAILIGMWVVVLDPVNKVPAIIGNLKLRSKIRKEESFRKRVEDSV